MGWRNRGSGDRGTQGKTLAELGTRPMRNENEDWIYRSLNARVAQSKNCPF